MDKEKEYAKKRFEEIKKTHKHWLSEAEFVVEVNSVLKKYSGAFVHPYQQGFELRNFKELDDKGELTSEIIFEYFSLKFFDLSTTAYFVDGYFKECEYLEPYCLLIDQSIILCLQKDYAGAINVLLPVIEGALRLYMYKKVSINSKVLNTETLLKAFFYLKKDYHGRLKNDSRSIDCLSIYRQTKFDDNQIKYINNLDKKRFDLWLSIIVDYFQNSLYLDTRRTSQAPSLNRHSIFHGFNDNLYFNFENYLKVFNCILFLHWVFSRAEGKNMMPTLEGSKTNYKWKAFEKIRVISRLSTEIKQSIYSKYPVFEKEDLKDFEPRNKADEIISSYKTRYVEKRLRFIDRSIKSE